MCTCFDLKGCFNWILGPSINIYDIECIKEYCIHRQSAIQIIITIIVIRTAYGCGLWTAAAGGTHCVNLAGGLRRGQKRQHDVTQDSKGAATTVHMIALRPSQGGVGPRITSAVLVALIIFQGLIRSNNARLVPTSIFCGLSPLMRCAAGLAYHNLSNSSTRGQQPGPCWQQCGPAVSMFLKFFGVCAPGLFRACRCSPRVLAARGC